MVFIADSKTPTGVAEVPLTDIAVKRSEIRSKLAGPGPWLFPSHASQTGHQTDFKKTWQTDARNGRASRTSGSTISAPRTPPAECRRRR